MFVQFIRVYRNASEKIDRGGTAIVVFLDIKKAFDTVPHAILMVKLVAHGVERKLLRWIGECLKGRKQRVVIGGEESGWMEVISGGPQGSILGPILFTVFVNDLNSDVLMGSKGGLDFKRAIGDSFWSSLDLFPRDDLRKVTFPLQL